MGKHERNPLRFASKYPDVSSGPVPVEPYISADYFEREREAAVRRHRLSLRRADGIPTAGDYFVKNPAVQGVSVRVIRGDEGQVRALHAARATFTTLAHWAALSGLSTEAVSAVELFEDRGSRTALRTRVSTFCFEAAAARKSGIPERKPMLESRDGWPVKTRELHNHHFDSTAWNDFAFRDDDIVIATYAKAGTTWTQQIVGQLVFGGADDVPVHEHLAVAGSARAADRRQTRPAGGADAPALHQDPPAGRRAGVLAARQVPLHRPRRARRGGESLQPPRQRHRGLVPDAERHARPGRSAHAAAGRQRRRGLRHLAGAGRRAVLAVFFQRALVVGNPPPAERAVRALRRHEARPARPDAAHRRFSGHHARAPRSGRPRSSIARSTTCAPTASTPCRPAGRCGGAGRRPSCTAARPGAGANC